MSHTYRRKDQSWRVGHLSGQFLKDRFQNLTMFAPRRKEDDESKALARHRSEIVGC